MLRCEMSAAQATTVPGWYVAACHVSIRGSPGLLLDRCRCGRFRVLPHLKACFEGSQAHTGLSDLSLMPSDRTLVGLAMSSPTMQGENLASLLPGHA